MTTTTVGPTLTKRERGGWLAVSSDTALVHIGVVGDTAKEAENNYAKALSAWQRLVALAQARTDAMR